MKKIIRLHKPLAIQFPINNICNSRCQMCNIWRQKRSQEISPVEVRTILKDPLFSETIDVGINGGEPTLRDDFIDIVKSVVDTLPKIQNIYLITNALQSNNVCLAIKSSKNVCCEKDVKLNVMISLDGLGDIHDRVRGCTGNFDSAVRVLDFLKSSEVANSICVGCTVIKDNVFSIEGLLDWCMKRDIHAYFRLGIPHRRLYNLNTLQPFDLNFQERFHFANFLDYLRLVYEKKESKRLFYKSLRNQIMYKNNRSVSCLWQSAGITLNSLGEISYCAVESETLGNALSDNPNNIYWGNRNHLSEIIRNKCKSCLHDYGPAPRIIGRSEKFKKNINKLIPQNFHKIIVNLKKSYKSKIKVDKIEKGSSFRIVENLNIENKILICGWYGTETLGDKAILGGLINAIRKCSDHKIDIASIEPYVTLNTKHQMPELNIDKILNLSEARIAIQKGHYGSVIMGGGPLMGPIRECHDILDLFLRAKKVGAITIVGCCGVGPLGWPEIDSVIGKILRVADYVIFRDRLSRDLAQKKLGIIRNSQVALDPAFVWAYSKSSLSSQERDPKQILLALRDWSINDYGNHFDYKIANQIKTRFENELKFMIKQLLVKNHNLKIIPFCMHKYARGGDDRFFYRRVFEDFPEVLENIEDCHKEPIEDLKMFSKSHSVLAMRFHSLVFAIATRTPVIAIDYTFGGKITGLLADLKAQQLMVKLNDFSGEVVANLLLSNPPNTPNIKNKVEYTESVLHQTLNLALNTKSDTEYSKLL